MRGKAIGLGLALAAGTAVGACQTTQEAQMLAPSAPLAPSAMPAINVGDTFVTEGGGAIKVVAGTDETYTFKRSDSSCAHTKVRALDFYAPVKRENCPFGSVTREISNIKGSLWPLQVGNEATFDVNITVQGRSSPYNGRCEVTDQGAMALPYGQDDVFKVICRDEIHVITSYYSPAKQALVKYRFDRPGRGNIAEYTVVAVER